MQKFAFAGLLFLFLQSYAFAQQSDASLFRGAQVYASYGLHFMNTSSLNNDLDQQALPAFGSTRMGVSIGGGAFLKRFYVGGQGAVQFGAKADDELYKSNLMGGYGMVQGGYVLVQKPALALYPTLGIGGGGSSINAEAGPAFAGNINELTTLPPERNFHIGYMLLDFGFNSDFFIGDGNKKFLIGVSAGYLWHPYVQHWTSQNEDLSSLSKFSPDGFYVKVKAGLGFFGE